MSLPTDAYRDHVRETMSRLLRCVPQRPFAVRLPDGSTIGTQPAGQEPAFTLVLKRPESLRRMFLPPSELAMGEGYIFDDFDIEGDIVAAFRFIDDLPLQRPSLPGLLRLAWQLRRLEKEGRRAPDNRQEPKQASRDGYDTFVAQDKLYATDRDLRAVQFHYDVSNDFYKLWLDERLVYSCAYYPDGNETLDQAQEKKVDLLCRRLDLQPGERLLDIGCGWGGLILHAAKRYNVSAMGITLSAAQAEEAQTRIDAAGLADRCQALVRHYEHLEAGPRFDKIVSIGMFEHVGGDRLSDYFARIGSHLQRDGLFLLQGGVARVDGRHAGRRWMNWLGRGRRAFTQKYSFPDSRLVDVPTILATAERARFEPLAATCMRPHYVHTLRHWLERLERNRQAAVAEVGETAYRCWRLILAGYHHLLDSGRLSEYQFLLANRGN